MEGLFKVDFDMNGKSGRSMMYVHAGRMIGGNTSFALLGNCRNIEGEMIVEINTQRHHPTRAYPALFESGEVGMRIRGRLKDGAYRFTGEVKDDPANSSKP